MANGHAEKGFPVDENGKPAEFRYMLVRFDDLPDREATVYGYSEVRRTRCVKWPKGMELPKTNPNQVRWRPKDEDAETEVCALFLNSPHLATRMKKLGWYDVTDDYRVWQREQQEQEKPVQTPPPKPVSTIVGRRVEVPEAPKAGKKAA